MTERRKPGPAPSLDPILKRAAEIQARKTLSLRDLRAKLAHEGHKVSIGALSEAGLAPDRLKASALAGKGVPAAPKPPAATPVLRPPPSPPPGSQGPPRAPIDANGDPLAFARGLRRALADVMAELDPDSGPYVKLSAEARQVNRQIAALEAARAGEETPEEAERRRRREDGEVRREMLQYVEQAERQAARLGICPHCEQPLAGAP